MIPHLCFGSETTPRSLSLLGGIQGTEVRVNSASHPAICSPLFPALGHRPPVVLPTYKIGQTAILTTYVGITLHIHGLDQFNRKT